MSQAFVSTDGPTRGDILIGRDVRVKLNLYRDQRSLYAFDIDTRSGRTVILWDGRAIFDDGKCNVLYDEKSRGRRLAAWLRRVWGRLA